MNRHTLDYCIGASDAYLAVWNDLMVILTNKQENWRETTIEYLKFINDKMNEWMEEATAILKEDSHYGKR